MKRQLRLKYLIKAAQDTSKDYELYLEAKTVAENNLSLDIPGIEELAELKDRAKQIISKSSSVPNPETISQEEFQNLRGIMSKPDEVRHLLNKGGSFDPLDVYFKKFSSNNLDFESSKFLFKKYLEYKSNFIRIASRKNYDSFDQSIFDKMMKDDAFLKQSGIIDHFEKRSLMKKSLNKEAGIWSAIKSSLKYLPIIDFFWNGYILFEDITNINTAINFINQKFSHLSQGEESLWMPGNIENLIEKYKDDPEKLLEVSYLNNTAQYLFKEGLDAILRAVMIVADFFLSYGVLKGIRIALAEIAGSLIGLGLISDIMLEWVDFDMDIPDKFAYAYHHNNGKIISITSDKLSALKSAGIDRQTSLPTNIDKKSDSEEMVTVF